MDAALQEILVASKLNSAFGCKTWFPDLFNTPFAPGHKEIFSLIDKGNRKKAVAAPRGIGKTTIARAYTALRILFQDVNFVVYVSNSATSAEMQTENLKADLLGEEVKRLFGDIKISRAEDLDDSFSRKSWVAFGSTLVLPRGAGQQVRGLNWRGYRPQLIIVDDLENSEEVLNELNRAKLKVWFHSDLEKSVNRYKNDWEIFYIDTVKHEAALLTELLESSDWDSCCVSLCDENYRTLFPFYMTTEEVQKEVDTHRENGLLDVFYREYMNQPISTEDAVFKKDYFKWYDEGTEEIVANKRIENVVIMDPAKTVKLHSADSAVICVGFDRTMGRVYFRDLVAQKLHPDQLVTAAIDMCLAWKAKVLACEVTGLEEFISHPIKTAISQRNVNIEFVELRARKQKEDRIAQMSFYYRKGMIWHNKAVCGPLEAQLLSFPRSKRFDAMDAAAYFIELLERGERYFYDDDAPEPVDDEIYPADLEPEIKNWRLL